MTTRQLLRLFVWGIGVLISIAVVIVAWAWSVPDVVDTNGSLVADTARIQTRTLLVLIVGFTVMIAGGAVIARRGDPARGRREVG